MDFRTGFSSIPRPTGFLEAQLLSDEEKKNLCRTLLSEFGVNRITRVREPDGEMIHSCCLGLGGHKSEDRNPSASLNYKKLTYKCYGCGNSGGLLWFIATCRGETTTQARSWLESQTGTGAEEQSLASLLQYFEAVYSPSSDVRAPIPKMNPSVLEQWYAIHPYMTEVRGVPAETIMHFSVGYNPEAKVWSGTGFVASERIVLPHFWRGDLVGWQTRRIWNDGTPKYVSSPDFPKDTTLFNYDPKRPAIVVESICSVLRHWHHRPDMVATIGASITDTQLRLLSQFPEVVLWMDNDDAGWKATERIGDHCQAYGNVWVVDNPWSADPGDVDDDTFDSLMSDLIPYSVWRRPDPASIQAWEAA